MFLGLPDPDPLVRGIDPDPDPDPTLIILSSCKYSKKPWILLFFATSFGLFIFDVNVIIFLRLEGQWRKEKDPDPNTLDIGMDPRIWIQIHTIMSWIRNTALPYEGPMHILFYNTGCTTYIWGFHNGSFPIIARAYGGHLEGLWCISFSLEAKGRRAESSLGLFYCLSALKCIVSCMVYSTVYYIQAQVFHGTIRETREGWPLLSVETRWMRTQREQMKGVLSWLVCWACRAGTRDFCSAD